MGQVEREVNRVHGLVMDLGVITYLDFRATICSCIYHKFDWRKDKKGNGNSEFVKEIAAEEDLKGQKPCESFTVY